MDYAVIRCIDGAFAIHSEHSGESQTDAEKKSAARAKYASYWAALENDKDFKGKAQIQVIDSQLNCVDGLNMLIDKTPTPAAEEPAES